MLEKSENVAVRVLVYLLTEDAKDAYDGQVNPGPSVSPLQIIWPYVVYALLAHFLSDDVLHAAQNSVSRGEQSATEDKMRNTQRGLDASR